MSVLDDQKELQTGQARRSIIPWEAVAWLGVAAGTILRFAGLSHQSLWIDEGYTAWMVTHPCGEILRLVRADTAPPLYYMLLHGWTIALGHSEWGLRSFSALCSTITLMLVLALARRLLVRPPAVAAAVWWLALTFNHIQHAQEARFYALMALEAVVAFYFLLNYVQTHYRRWLFPLALVLAAALYTHNLMLPYVAAIFFSGIILAPRRFLDFLLTAIAVALLYLPWAILVLPAQLRLVEQGFWVSRPDFSAIMSVLSFIYNLPMPWASNAVLAQCNIPLQTGYDPLVAAILLATVLLVMSMGLERGERRRLTVALAILILFPPVIVTVYSFIRTPILMEKTFLGSASLMPILLLLPLNLRWSAAGLRIAFGTLAALFLVTLGWLIAGTLGTQNENWRGAAEIVKSLPLPHGRLIVFVAEDGQLPFQYYYQFNPQREDVTGVPAGFFDLNPPRAMRRLQGIEDLTSLALRIKNGNYDQVVLVECHLQFADPQGLTHDFLQQQFSEVKTFQLRDVTVSEFEKNRDANQGPRWAEAMLSVQFTHYSP